MPLRPPFQKQCFELRKQLDYRLNCGTKQPAVGMPAGNTMLPVLGMAVKVLMRFYYRMLNIVVEHKSPAFFFALLPPLLP
jgi:hypothetical protein